MVVRRVLISIHLAAQRGTLCTDIHAAFCLAPSREGHLGSWWVLEVMVSFCWYVNQGPVTQGSIVEKQRMASSNLRLRVKGLGRRNLNVRSKSWTWAADYGMSRTK